MLQTIMLNITRKSTTSYMKKNIFLMSYLQITKIIITDLFIIVSYLLKCFQKKYFIMPDIIYNI